MSDDPGARALREAVDALGASGVPAQVFDHDGRLHWVSEEMMRLSGFGDTADLGLGENPGDDAVEAGAWASVLGEATFATLRAEIARRLDPAADHAPLWLHPEPLSLVGRRLQVGVLGITLRSSDGTVAGTAMIYAPNLPGRVLALVAEGDEAMLGRIAELTEPAQRPSAVLFADLDSSGPLARRLPTATYFELVRGVTSAFDDLVIEHGGIVGKHAGDGASAFFLAETLGGDAAAARAGLRAALALPAAVRAHTEAMAQGGLEIGGGDACRFNVGLHWGANTYLGQVVTGGRLEVTALGDEVNECARIEQTATGGQVLVSKTLVERLAPDAVAELGLPTRGLLYRTLGELAGEGKAVRDAATLAVVDLSS